MLCLSCQCPTENPKFCSKSCAAQYNNRLFPKRTKRDRHCQKCLCLVGVGRRLCNDCLTVWKKKIKDGSRVPYERVTKGDVLTEDSQRFRRIRETARKVALEAGYLHECSECGYTIHVEACHITPIKEFPDTALLSDINATSNLIGLCRNHHWELDHGFLKIEKMVLE